jgi:broad specificity phosphatase PhoE
MRQLRLATPRVLVALVLSLLVAPVTLAAQAIPATVVILVRHAEKEAAPANDPPLTAGGRTRAAALLAVARDAGVGAIITTQFVRTRATAEPVATALGVQAIVVPAAGGAQAVADTIRHAYAGKTVLVVGHSNTIPAIVAALGGPRGPDLCDAEYDALFVMVLDGPTPRLIRSRYGEPSPPAAGCGSMR